LLAQVLEPRLVEHPLEKDDTIFIAPPDVHAKLANGWLAWLSAIA
jgi:hypothetical protein